MSEQPQPQQTNDGDKVASPNTSNILLSATMYEMRMCLRSLSCSYAENKSPEQLLALIIVFLDVALKDLVETWLLAFSDVQLATIDAPPTPHYKAIRAKVKAFVDEHRLRRWVLHRNINNGLALQQGT